MILRLYGKAQVIHEADAAWNELFPRFPALPGARQIYDLAIDLVTTSCGFGVPLYEYQGDRSLLNDWANAKGREGIRTYWEKKNQQSIDGLPTSILEKSRT